MKESLLFRTRIGDYVAICMLALIVMAYLGLTPLGQWQADEYAYFSQFAHGFWNALLMRLRWSPRPLSELIYGGYGVLTIHVQKPLTGGFLGLLWAGFLASSLIWAFHPRSERKASTTQTLLCGLVLVGGFLVAGPSFEVFYWPAGAVAYLPTLTGTTLLFLLILEGALATMCGRRKCCFCLLLIGMSSEMGATLVACFSILQAAETVSIYFSEQQRSFDVAELYWWILPAGVAGSVLLSLYFHRAQVSEPFSVISPSLHHPMLGARAAVQRIAFENIGFESGTQRWTTALARLLSKVLVAIGFAVIWSQAFSANKSIRRQLIGLTVVFVAASFLAVAASYSHLGALPAGGRYQTLCRSWFLMGLISIAVVLLTSRRFQSIRQLLTQWNVGPLFLVIGVLMVWHVRPLIRQYSVYGSVERTIIQNFRSGLQRDSRQMTFVQVPNRGVILAATIAPGTYIQAEPSSNYDSVYATSVLSYFDKDLLIVSSNGDGSTPKKGQSPVDGHPVQ